MTCRITLVNGHVLNHHHLSAVELLNKIAEIPPAPSQQVIWLQKDDGKRIYIMVSAIATVEEL